MSPLQGGYMISDLCVFQDADMWSDAMRICKEYIPNKLSLLQEEYESETSKKGIGWD